MKRKYNINQQFFVTFVINDRKESYEKFKINSIRNKELGLFETISKAENQKLSDGEVAQALLDRLNSIYSDNTYSHRLIAILNWWAI